MRDVFYTILIVWVVWKVIDSISTYNKRGGNSTNTGQSIKRAEGETSVDYVPPTKKKINDDDGEYVDYEEVK